jgi:hypothetical protein
LDEGGTGAADLGREQLENERRRQGRRKSSMHEKERGGYTGNRRRRPGRSSGGGHENRKIGSDTMLGIDELYSLRAKGHNI